MSKCRSDMFPLMSFSQFQSPQGLLGTHQETPLSDRSHLLLTLCVLQFSFLQTCRVHFLCRGSTQKSWSSKKKAFGNAYTCAHTCTQLSQWITTQQKNKDDLKRDTNKAFWTDRSLHELSLLKNLHPGVSEFIWFCVQFDDCYKRTLQEVESDHKRGKLNRIKGSGPYKVSPILSDWYHLCRKYLQQRGRKCRSNIIQAHCKSPPKSRSTATCSNTDFERKGQQFIFASLWLAKAISFGISQVFIQMSITRKSKGYLQCGTIPLGSTSLPGNSHMSGILEVCAWWRKWRNSQDWCNFHAPCGYRSLSKTKRLPRISLQNYIYNPQYTHFLLVTLLRTLAN